MAKMDAAQRSGLQTVSEGPFQELASEALLGLASGTSDSAPIDVCSQLGFTLILPAAPSSVGLGHVASNAFSLQVRHRGVAVIAAVQHQLSQSVGLPPAPAQTGQPAASLRDSLLDGLGITLGRFLNCHGDHHAGAQIHRVFDLVCQMGPANRG